MFSLEQEIDKIDLFDQLRPRFPVEWSKEADNILRGRYLLKDDYGKVIETKEELIYRVASHIGKDSIQIERFYEMISSGKFLPNTPTLVNSKGKLGMLSACLVLPTGDSIEAWAKTLSDHMVMTKAGIGTGVDLSPMRQEGSLISTTKGEAAGALGFLEMLNNNSKIVKQGSIRPSANMATMRITHPDLIDFINSKNSELNLDGIDLLKQYKSLIKNILNDATNYDKGTIINMLISFVDTNTNGMQKVFNKLQQFNISITAYDEEFKALFDGDDIPIIEPHTGKLLGYNKAEDILRAVVNAVHDSGDPGLLNLTKANDGNPIVEMINPLTGEMFGLKFTTNPCGEQWLYAYSVCNLGSINLTKFVKDQTFDFTAFAVYVEWAIEFLDAVIDANIFPIAEVTIMSEHLRNIGLGIMGWGDTLLMLGIPYQSRKAIDLAEHIMMLFKSSADYSSSALAQQFGVAPVFFGSKHPYRNYERSCIAPTGSISLIAGCSSGIEPNFTFAYKRHTTIKGAEQMFVTNPILKKFLTGKYPGSYKAKIQEIIDNGGIVSDNMAYSWGLSENYWQTTFDVSPEWHIRHQAVFQKYVDNAVSKTINMPESTTPQDIMDAYKLSWELGCKGITVYRDKSRSYQILNSKKKEDILDGEKEKQEQGQGQEKEKDSQKQYQGFLNQEIDPIITFDRNICCDQYMPVKYDGCTKCVNCGYSYCG